MASSPLHTAYTESRPNSNGQNTPGDAHSPLLPGSGRASAAQSQHTRRLQLRNAGFRGAALPTRSVTPVASDIINWSSVTGLQAPSSDVENVAPSGKRAGVETGTSGFGSGSTRESSGGILQDIGNANSATMRQANSKRTRVGVTSGKFWTSPNDVTSSNRQWGSSADGPASSPLPTVQQPSNTRARSGRISRAKMGKPRRSISGETRRYVDHLEQQLSEAQTQLNAMTSPTVTREQSSKMRHLNAETKQLQEEVAGWEAEFDERLQSELDKHFHVEAGLRSRVRHLEDAAEETRFLVQDLEIRLETTTQNLDAVETANVNLEKRLEIMSELLAASPTKIDLHGEMPGRSRQGRPSSMLPRFPTAGSLAASPERSSSHTNAGSPTSSLSRFSARIPVSPANLNYSPEVTSDDDDRSGSSDTNSVIVAPPPAKRPARRMRRFGAGSIGPKPLILPSTSHLEQMPASAPPFDREDGQPAFPFSPRVDAVLAISPRDTRRSASSESSPLPIRFSPSRLTSLEPTNNGDGLLNDGFRFGSPPSRLSLVTTRDVSSIGSALGAAVGRNLMEELTAARTSETDSSNDEMEDTQLVHPQHEDPNSSPFESDAEDASGSLPEPSNEMAMIISDTASRFVSDSSTAVATVTAQGTIRMPDPPKLHSRRNSRSLSAHSKRSISTLDSLRTIFSDLLRSPVELAKHLIQTAQSRMRIPRPLLTVQWWLVGVLLGPMARRRMLGRSSPCCNDPASEQRSLIDPSDDPETELAYGTAYQTPHSSPASNRARTLVAGKGKKRASSTALSSPSTTACCPHHPRRLKHSPLLWLKFSMTLALAVGVAFKDGPRSLLKDAVCQCKRGGRRLSGGNWRKAGREDRVVTPGGRE